MLPLHTHLQHEGPLRRTVFKVISPEEQKARQWPAERCLVWDPAGARDVSCELKSGEAWGGWLTPTDRPRPASWPSLWASRVRDRAVIGEGDVIRLRHDGSQVSVLYRRGSMANALFATDRCNSLCLMCSQPPRPEDDSWRVAEMLEVVSLVDPEESQLGITGGEPTLLGDGLVRVIEACRDRLPGTAIHVLTNGRRFADRAFAGRVAAANHGRVVWAVPLYADTPDTHDYVVQAEGAFDETIRGLYELARRRSAIEIRVVLHRLTVPRLGALANFIYRNLPFASHVALMGLEPMGFAKLNRELLWIDPLDYVEELADACFHLDARGMRVSVYNLPLCVLPRELWQFARQSISDWKNTYVPECEGCAVRDRCAGFFVSAGTNWRSRGIRRVEDHAAQMAVS